MCMCRGMTDKTIVNERKTWTHRQRQGQDVRKERKSAEDSTSPETRCRKKEERRKSARSGIEIPKTHTKQPFERQLKGSAATEHFYSLVAVGCQVRCGKLIGF